jgi:hypothetical protein
LDRLLSSTLPGANAQIKNSYEIKVTDGTLTEKNLVSHDGKTTYSTTKYLYNPSRFQSEVGRSGFLQPHQKEDQETVQGTCSCLLSSEG